MAQREETQNNVTYLVVKHHSLCEESKTPKEGFEPVEVFNPKTKETTTKYIDKWGAVTGYITKIDVYDTKDTYQTRFQGFKIHIDDEVVVDLPQKTAAYDAFCKSCENIDYSKPVTFSAYHNRSKDRTGFSIKQDGQGVDWNYTKDNMGDCPAWEIDEDGEPDTRKQRAFLKSRVVDFAVPAVEAANAARNAATSTSGEAEAPKAEAATASAGGKGKGKGKSAPAPAPVDEDEIPF